MSPDAHGRASQLPPSRELLLLELQALLCYQLRPVPPAPEVQWAIRYASRWGMCRCKAVNAVESFFQGPSQQIGDISGRAF